MPRFHVDPADTGTPLASAPPSFALPEGAARHVQVLRLQPGSPVILFDGRGGEWQAVVVSIGRREVVVRLEAHVEVDRELPFDVRLAFGMPANDRMDYLVEKATELGAATLQPLVCERSVLRLDGERAARKVAHWQAIAVAAAEQSGRTRVPVVASVTHATAWLAGLPPVPGVRWLLGFGADAVALPALLGRGRLADIAEPVWGFSGPEGGIAPAEADAAQAAGFRTASLGARVLRADTAPLALLAMVALLASA